MIQNTASRLESNGEGDRIQVSEETAELLRASGKEHWLTKRHDLVTAKGKGDLQCYWAQVVGSYADTMSTSFDGTFTSSGSSEAFSPLPPPRKLLSDLQDVSSNV